MILKEIVTGDFKLACRDYFYLLTQGYPERGSLKIVGDRYRLSRDQRSVLYRGISSEKKSGIRNARLVPISNNMHLVIDGYNVLFTVLNYRLGRAIFISTDGIVRDAGSLHGKLRDEDIFHECIDDLFTTIVPLHPSRVDIFLDSPVSASQRHHQELQKRLGDFNLIGECRLVHSADQEIKSFNTGVLVSSDTALIEKTTVPVTDLARSVLEKKFGAEFYTLQEFLDAMGNEGKENAGV
jgi:hypothetical protein